MSDPVISVVMSVRNGERFLREAVESILAQTFCDFEFVIINDGSTDGTAAILDCYRRVDERVKVHHRPNRGLIDALNHGCELSNGKYIARMDADDIAVADRFARQIDFMEKQPIVAVVGGAVQFINAVGEPLITYAHPAGAREIKSALLLQDSAIWHPTAVMRRDVFASVGGYRKVVVDAEDYDLWLRIADCWELANVGDVVLKYRLHPNQVSTKRHRQQVLSGMAAQVAAVSRRGGKGDPLNTIDEITPAVLCSLGVKDSVQRAALARKHLCCIRTMYEAGEYTAAVDLLAETSHSSDWHYAAKWVVAERWLFAARLHRRRGKRLRGLLAVTVAVLTRPKMVGGPAKLLWTRLHSLFSSTGPSSSRPISRSG